MNKRYTLFLAMAGTYDPNLITSNLVPVEYDFTKIKRSYRKVKKILKYNNVVIEIHDRLLGFKIPYILVIPAKGVDNTLWYMERGWVEIDKKYAYFNKRKELKRKVPREHIIQLDNKELLNEYLEGND